MTKGPNDYYARYLESDLRRTFDEDIESEKTKTEAPPGHASEGYSEELWNSCWESRIIDFLYNGEFPDSYEGPSNEEWVWYIITERRKAGLPELDLPEHIEKKVEQIARSNGG